MTAAGFGWQHVAESIVYVTDMTSVPEVLKAFAGSIPGSTPAGTVVGTGLVSPEGRVEIMLTAAK
jgi:enamine deaminase RidA (YjgF/YER057c/UK114 family)